MLRSMAILSLCLSILPAHASPVLWTLTGVAFSDGGTATGSFVYDRDTNTYSDVNIASTAGTNFAGAVYTAIQPTYPQAPGNFVASESATDQTDANVFRIEFVTGLTNAGGTIPLYVTPFFGIGSVELLCVDPICNLPAPVLRNTVSGSVVSVIPVPAAVWLFGSALTVMGWMRRTASA